MAGRVVTGGVLVAGIARLGPSAESDLALALTAILLFNLVTNGGIPTLLVRRALNTQGGEHGYDGVDASPSDLAVTYCVLTGLGAAIAFPVGLVLFSSTLYAFLFVALFVSLSLFSGLEYWALANDAYRVFLAQAVPIQIVLGSLAPLAVWLLRTGEGGIALLTVSYTVAFVYTVRKVPIVRSRITVSVKRCWTDFRGAGLEVAAGTAGAALLYSIDVFVLRYSGMIGVDAQYRLSVTVLGMAIGMLPVGIFVLAQVSSGEPLRFRSVRGYIAIASIVPLIASFPFAWLGPDFGTTSYLLRLLLPLTAIRMASQIAVSALQGSGFHRDVAVGYWSACVLWALGGYWLLAHLDSLGYFVLLQTAVEGALLLWLVMSGRRRGGAVGLPNVGESPLRGDRD